MSMGERNTERDGQAAELRKLFNEVQGNEVENRKKNGESNSTHENDLVIPNDAARKVDILDLPPRKVVHSNKQIRTRLRLSRPFARLSVVIILLLIVVLGVFYLWSVELIQLPINT